MKASNKLSFYFSTLLYLINTKILKKDIPFMGGIAINDLCNLHCSYCSVSNRNIPDLSFDDIKSGLLQLYNKGIRYLYIEGGEPFLWKDNSKGPEDVIKLARDIGFRFITIYTNGTLPIETEADTVFVSLDGTEKINNSVRGNGYAKIIQNIKNSKHKKIIINCTISAKNKDHIEDFCIVMNKIKNIKGIFFYFYTAGNTGDELSISKEEKTSIINKISGLKKKGYRLLNSQAGLKSTLNSKWKKPNDLSYLYADNKLYQCCRFIDSPGVCENCGYLGFSEIYLLTRLNINAVLTAFKYL